jgi:hypothetical protein
MCVQYSKKNLTKNHEKVEVRNMYYQSLRVYEEM